MGSLSGGGGSGGPTALSGITAAIAANNTLANGNFTGQNWNWSVTSDAVSAHSLGETVAAINGTTTGNIPNQVLLKLQTKAGSTMSPLQVYSNDVHAFSVSASATPQILATDGSAAATPSYSFAVAPDSGMWSRTSGNVSFSRAGTLRFEIGTTVSVNGIPFQPTVGSAAAPGISDAAANTSGFFFGSGLVGMSISAVENNRLIAGGIQLSKGSGDAVSYAVNARKSRGTVAVPTVITSGDALLTISGFGYLGATNTYREAARIEFDSAGTISDATNGIGSSISIKGTTQGTDTAPQDTIIIAGGSTATLQLKGSGMVAANGTVATVLGSLGPTGSNTTVQEWLAIKTNGGTTRYIPCF